MVQKVLILWVRIQEWLIAQWGAGWWISFPLTIVLGAVWSPLLQPLLVSSDDPQTLYLLSAIAQALAAVLALVFSIVLVAAQLSSRYSSRMLGGFFDNITIAYICLFIASVVLPFWLMANPYPNEKSPHPTSVKISLSLATIALCLLVPYFLSFKKKLNPEVMLTNLQRSALQQFSAVANTEPAEIRIIDNAVMSAYVSKDYDTFECGVYVLGRVAEASYTYDLKDIGDKVMERLRDICIATLDDPRAPVQTIKIIKDVGTTTSRLESNSGIWSTSRQLEEIGLRAIDLRSEKLALQVVRALLETARTVGRIELDEDKRRSESLGGALLEIARATGNLGIKAAHCQLEASAQWATDALDKIGLAAIKKGDTSTAIMVADSLGKLGAQAARSRQQVPVGWVLAALDHNLTSGLESLSLVPSSTKRLVNAIKEVGCSVAQESAHFPGFDTFFAVELLKKAASSVDQASAFDVSDVVITAIAGIWEIGAWNLGKNLLADIMGTLKSLEIALGSDKLDDGYLRTALWLRTLGHPELIVCIDSLAHEYFTNRPPPALKLED